MNSLAIFIKLVIINIFGLLQALFIGYCVSVNPLINQSELRTYEALGINRPFNFNYVLLVKTNILTKQKPN